MKIKFIFVQKYEKEGGGVSIWTNSEFQTNKIFKKMILKKTFSDERIDVTELLKKIDNGCFFEIVECISFGSFLLKLMN